MVFHITNYMRETNVWMIRKMRWIFWSIVLALPVYRTTYWDYHGRRVAWAQVLFHRESQEEKMKKAAAKKANWGYQARFEPRYWFSIKKAKHDQQTPQEKIEDTPRVFSGDSKEKARGDLRPQRVSDAIQILMEHNRKPGTFDYKYPQNFYSLLPHIEHNASVVLGTKKVEGKQNAPYAYLANPAEAKPDY